MTTSLSYFGQDQNSDAVSLLESRTVTPLLLFIVVKSLGIVWMKIGQEKGNTVRISSVSFCFSVEKSRPRQ